MNSIILDINRDLSQPGWDVIGFVDADPEKIGTKVFGVMVFSAAEISKLDRNEEIFACCPLLNTEIRKKVVNEDIVALNLTLANIIHPSVNITSTAELSTGVIIFPNVIIGDKASIGKGAIINYSSIIGHDVVIGANCFLGPGVILTGRCKIGEDVLLGAGSVYIPGIEIGSNCRIAAGLVATSNIEANSTVLLRQNIVKL